jgi:hypothetical protein
VPEVEDVEQQDDGTSRQKLNEIDIGIERVSKAEHRGDITHAW